MRQLRKKISLVWITAMIIAKWVVNSHVKGGWISSLRLRSQKKEGKREWQIEWNRTTKYEGKWEVAIITESYEELSYTKGNSRPLKSNYTSDIKFARSDFRAKALQKCRGPHWREVPHSPHCYNFRLFQKNAEMNIAKCHILRFVTTKTVHMR